jgi:GntR family transcriptional regulator
VSDNNFIFQLDLRDETPLFEQIAAHLRSEIHSSGLEAGVRLPTVRELARQLRVNFNTVARAYRILDSEGLILSRQGQGSFVTVQSEAQEFHYPTTEQITLEQLIENLQLVAQEAGYQLDDVIKTYQRQSISRHEITIPPKKKRRTHHTHRPPLSSYLALLSQTLPKKQNLHFASRRSKKNLSRQAQSASNHKTK